MDGSEKYLYLYVIDNGWKPRGGFSSFGGSFFRENEMRASQNCTESLSMVARSQIVARFHYSEVPFHVNLIDLFAWKAKSAKYKKRKTEVGRR